MMMDVNKPLEGLLDEVPLNENNFVRGNCTWKVSSLLQYIKDNGYRPKKMPLWCLNLGGIPWDITNMAQMANHVSRVMSCDLKYPIILDDFGQIADGNHRVLKAIAEGREYIMAYRLRDMPEPDKED